MSDWIDLILKGAPDVEALAGSFPWAPAMSACPQDALYHAEGDVWTHTKMVAAGLESGEGFDALPGRRQDALRLAAWMHDIGKPATTEIAWCPVEGRERVRQPGHAPLGAAMAWSTLIDAGIDARLARDVHSLVFWHQRPTHLLDPDQKYPLKRVIRFSAETCETSWDDLLRLCRADQNGRISPNVEDGLLMLDLVAEMIREEGLNPGVDLLRAPWPFESREARLTYLRSGPEGSPWHAPQPATGSRMILLSGLPGSGKDTLARNRFPDLPVVSLDAIRSEMGVGPLDDQGRVRQAALEAARVHLRRGDDFIWNATCLSRSVRQKICGLAVDYGARIEAISIDVPLGVALARNAGRADPVPEGVIRKLAMKREPIGADEAHRLWTTADGAELVPVFGGETRAPEPAPEP
jgi:predicted kinase